MNDTDNILYKDVDIELIAKLNLPKLKENDPSLKIIFYNQWKILYQQHLDEIKEVTRSTYLIEIEKTHWVTLQVQIGNDDIKGLAYYVDPCGNPIPQIVEDYFDNTWMQVEIIDDIQLSETHQSWIYSLYYAKYFVENSSGSDFQFLSQRSDEPEDKFKDKVKLTLNEINKIRNKIKVCSETFSNAIKENIPVISDFKRANLFLFFLESLALEDSALKNNELKEYLEKEIIGKENIKIIKEIRSDMLLHRTKSHVIFPQDFHKSVFKECSTKLIFEDLEVYLKKITENLEGDVNNDIIREPKDILRCSEELREFGNYVEIKEVKHILSDYSTTFVKESFSLSNFKQPDEIMFNFIVNFVPLLELLYAKQKKPFTSILNLRNQLIHNIYILYQARPDLPNITLQRLLQNFKEELLIFNLGHKISAALKEFPEGGECDKLEAKLSSCFVTFRNEFLRESNSEKGKTGMMAFVDEKLSDEKKLYFLTELYLKSVAVIDEKNEIIITDMKTQSYSLPSEYYIFTNEQRKKIFEYLIPIKETHDLLASSGKNRPKLFTQAGFEVFVQNIQQDLEISVSLQAKDFKLMYDSVLNSKTFPNAELVEKVSNYISSLVESNSNIKVILEEFDQVLQGISIKSKHRQKTFSSIKEDSDELLEIFILNKSIYMNLCSIVRNVITVLFDLSNKIFPALDSLEEACNHELLLRILVNEHIHAEKLKEHVLNIPFLVPLGTKLMMNRKLTFRGNEEIEFMKKCISPLLKSPNKTEHIGNLLEFKPKSTEFLNECYEKVLQNISALDINRLKTLFENKEFESKIFKTLLSESSDLKNLKKNEVKLVKDLMNFKYISSIKSYGEENYRKSLEYIDGKKGISKMLKILIENGYVTQSANHVIRKKYFMAKVKTGVGVSELLENKSESEKHFREVLLILNALIQTVNGRLHWELKISATIAHTHHLLGECNESLQKYKEIFFILLNIRNYSPDVHLSDEIPTEPSFFKTLMRCKEYKAAVKKYPNILNVLKVWNSIAFELICLGKLSTTHEERREFYKKAVEEFLKANEIQRKVLGLHHPLTMSSLLQIGKITCLLKRPSKDIILYKKVMDVYKFQRKGSAYQTSIWKVIDRYFRKVKNIIKTKKK